MDSHREDPLRVFSVVDQVDGAPAIRISGERWGGLVTREAYRDYRLVVEFRWGLATWGERRSAARDSGVLVHAQGPDGNTGADVNGPWMRSIEAQVIEGGVGDIILVAGFDAEGRKLTPHMTGERAERTGTARPSSTRAARPGSSRPGASTGSAATRTGRTGSASGAGRTSRARTASGPVSR